MVTLKRGEGVIYFSYPTMSDRVLTLCFLVCFLKTYPPDDLGLVVEINALIIAIR